jgi:hypothetical protein
MGRTQTTFKDWLGHPSTVVAMVLLVFGMIVVSLEAQSQNWVYYTGQHVTGTVDGGIVYYRVGGEQYTLDDPQVPQPANGTKVGVYYHAGNPSAGMLDRPVRWVEGTGMLIWFVAAGVLLLVAGLRRARDSRRRAAAAADQARWWPTKSQRSV